MAFDISLSFSFNSFTDPDQHSVTPGTLEATAAFVRGQWAEKLDRIQIKGASNKNLEIFYTAVVHALTYPSEQHEEGRYYSAYDNKIHEGSESYTAYSIWVGHLPHI